MSNKYYVLPMYHTPYKDTHSIVWLRICYYKYIFDMAGWHTELSVYEGIKNLRAYFKDSIKNTIRIENYSKNAFD